MVGAGKPSAEQWYETELYSITLFSPDMSTFDGGILAELVQEIKISIHILLYKNLLPKQILADSSTRGRCIEMLAWQVYVTQPSFIGPV